MTTQRQRPSGIVLLGLDGEMTDSELADGAALIQIGLALDDGSHFSAILGHPAGSYHYTDAGMAVHGIDIATIDAAPPPATIDAECEQWLRDALADRGYRGNTRRLVPVGWNVGAFDLPFVRTFLPRTNALLSRRVIDLNAFIFSHAASRRLWEGEPRNWREWKSLAEAHARRALAAQGVADSWHDAGYDARAALHILEFLADPDAHRPGS